MDDAPIRPRLPRFRMGLMDMFILTAGFAGAFGAARMARPSLDSMAAASFLPDRSAVAAALVSPAVWLGCLLTRQAWRSARLARGSPDRGRGVAWRLAGAIFLGLYAAQAWSLFDPDPTIRGMSYTQDRQRGWPRLTLICSLIAMIGLLAGLRPARHRDRDRPDRAFWRIARLAAALAVGAALLYDPVVISLLVLIAINGVRGAMTQQWSPLPSLPERLGQVGWLAAFALGACVVAAYWIAGDLRRGVLGSRLSPRARSFRVANVAAAVVSAALLVAIGAPRIDPWFAEGIRFGIGPAECLLVVATMAVMATGMTARAIAGTTAPPEAPRPPMFLIRLAVRAWRWTIAIALLAIIALSSSIAWRVWTTETWRHPEPPEGTFAYGLWFLEDWFNNELTDFDSIFYGAAFVWIATRAIGLVIAPKDGPAPFDAAWADRKSRRDLIAHATSLTLVCLAAIPALFLSGLSVLQAVLARIDAV